MQTKNEFLTQYNTAIEKVFFMSKKKMAKKAVRNSNLEAIKEFYAYISISFDEANELQIEPISGWQDMNAPIKENNINLLDRRVFNDAVVSDYIAMSHDDVVAQVLKEKGVDKDLFNLSVTRRVMEVYSALKFDAMVADVKKFTVIDEGKYFDESEKQYVLSYDTKLNDLGIFRASGEQYNSDVLYVRADLSRRGFNEDDDDFLTWVWQLCPN